MISRRSWLKATVMTGSGVLSAQGILAQEPPQGQVADTSNLFPMDQAAARPVRLPPKPGAQPVMTPAERDAMEHRIRCNCGCTMDIYTCRTTDFTCVVSPAMHRDVLALVVGGYAEPEILDAFVSVYGERVLMAPPKVGFNILAYVMPGIALGIGAIVLAVVLRRWRRIAVATATPTRSSQPGATPEEIAQLEAAIRDDS